MRVLSVEFAIGISPSRQASITQPPLKPIEPTRLSILHHPTRLSLSQWVEQSYTLVRNSTPSNLKALRITKILTQLRSPLQVPPGRHGRAQGDLRQGAEDPEVAPLRQGPAPRRRRAIRHGPDRAQQGVPLCAAQLPPRPRGARGVPGQRRAPQVIQISFFPSDAMISGWIG